MHDGFRPDLSLTRELRLDLDAAVEAPRALAPVGRQNLRRAQIGDADAVLDFFWLLFTTVQAAARSHQELVLENLLLRHQLAVLTRPTRSRPQARLRLWDKLLWIVARRFCAGWREHLSFVTRPSNWWITWTGVAWWMSGRPRCGMAARGRPAARAASPS